MKVFLCALLFAVTIVSNGGLRVDSGDAAPAAFLEGDYDELEL